MRSILTSIVVMSALAISASAEVTVFTNFEDWTRTTSQISNVFIGTETFGSSQVSLPNLSITTRSGTGSTFSSGNGSIVNGEWSDCVGRNGCNGLTDDVTEIAMDKPLYAFGGNWNLASANPGGLEISTDGFSGFISPNEHSTDGPYATGAAYQGFFGFISTDPFTTVTLASSQGAQSFGLKDLVLGIDPPPPGTAFAPEPAYFLPLGALLLLGASRFARLVRLRA